MPKKTLKQIAEENGLTRDQLNAARTHGVDPWDPGQVFEWAESRRPRVGKFAELPADEPDMAGEDVTIESIEQELKRERRYETIKMLREKLAGLKLSIQVRKELRELVAIGVVDERDTRIAAAVKAAILRFCNDMAPQVEGLSAAKAHKVLMQGGRCILEQLADDQSAFWQNT